MRGPREIEFIRVYFLFLLVPFDPSVRLVPFDLLVLFVPLLHQHHENHTLPFTLICIKFSPSSSVSTLTITKNLTLNTNLAIKDLKGLKGMKGTTRFKI